jgi:mono/diheme cytochrome c family protein
VTAIFLFALAAWIFRIPPLLQTVRHCSILALASVPVTAASGVMDWQHFYHGPWSTPFIVKMALAVLLFASLLAVVIKGSRKDLPIRRLMPVYGFALLITAGLGYFGGELVYGQRAAKVTSPTVDVRPGHPETVNPVAPPAEGSGVQGQEPVPAVKDKEGVASDTAGSGRELFQRMCSFCHYSDSTEVKIGPGLKGILRSETLPVSGWPANEENVRKQLKTPYGTMPPFPDLSEEEIGGIIAYLKTL